MSIKRNAINIFRSFNNRIKFKNATILTPYVIGNSKVDNQSLLNEGVIFDTSEIGSFSYINRNSIVKNTRIGKYCSISFNCVIGAEDHNLRNLSTSPFFEAKEKLKKNTIIEDDVWVGANVIIKAGVRIGRGAVIGAGSVVTKDIDPFSICVGLPASAIKSRLDYFTDAGKKILIELNYNLDREILLNLQHDLEKERK